MSVKQKILNAIATHPKLATFAIGMAITMAVGIAITGMLEVQQAHASAIGIVAYTPRPAFALKACSGC
jgi:hypothetical protein